MLFRHRRTAAPWLFLVWMVTFLPLEVLFSVSRQTLIWFLLTEAVIGFLLMAAFAHEQNRSGHWFQDLVAGISDRVPSVRDDLERPDRPPEFVCKICRHESWEINERVNGFCRRCRTFTRGPEDL